MELFLRNNKITTLKKENVNPDMRSFFDDFTNLEVLDLSNNQITDIEGRNFIGLVRVRNLNLSNNQIQSLPSNAFENICNLYVLNFSHNQINEIQKLTFIPLGLLRDLKLNNNQLQIIKGNDPESTFRGLVRLQRLRLDHNPLVIIESNAFKALNALHMLTLPKTDFFIQRFSYTHEYSLLERFNRYGIKENCGVTFDPEDE